ncbi:hypothetical protein N656DRAFT_777758 [Canariomyces notabilis]|uniref:Uncharacterized protein n=1 Tax=Canariomyces notabilis TaxID=2074819 RepID=A0AAN6TG46_9PEZI|nr:hypothetical protein N656DRAFT_777758 [Canariomyces arenarius]
MSGVGLEVLLEDLIPEIAYSGEKGESNSSLYLPFAVSLSFTWRKASSPNEACSVLSMDSPSKLPVFICHLYFLLTTVSSHSSL